MAENLSERQLVAAVRFARQGDKTKARSLLEEILKQERSNEQAWIWLASVVESPKERRVCIERVIKINPRNAPAQAALNTMVGVLAGGEQPKIDYEALSKAAAKPLPTTGTRKEAAPPPRNLAGGERRSIRPLLIGGAIVLVILFLLTLIPASGIFTDVEETATPTEAIAEITEAPTDTPDPFFTPPSPTVAPTATFDGVFVEVTRSFTLPPTFTPTITPIPSETAIPTSTLPSITNYNWFFLATQGTSLPAIYRMNGNGEGLSVFIANIGEFDYNITTGLLAFTELSSVTDEAGNSQMVTRLFIAPIGAMDQRTEITSASMPSAISPAFSPDGTKLAFSSNADGDYEIYIYDVDTRVLRQMTNNTGFSDIDPDWSSGGSNLVYSSDSNTPSKHALYNMSATATDRENSSNQLTRISSDNTNAAWSPTSDYITFTSATGSGTKIMLTDAEGSFVRELTFISSYLYSQPEWTSDGNYIVFTAGPEDGNQEITLVPVESGRTISFPLDGFTVLQIAPR